MSIRLSEKHGVNPAMSICPRCSGDGDEIILAGAAYKYECGMCGQMHVGKHKECGRCGSSALQSLGEFDGSRERVLASEPCAKCREELDSHKDLVSKGGVYWKCSDCKKEGVIMKSNFAGMVRARLKIKAPKSCGVEFDKDDCPACGGE